MDEVYENVRKKLPTISKATVYRNLKYLADIGSIKEVLIKGVIRYESNVEPHHHAICWNCGKIIDFESRELTTFALNMAEQLQNFVLRSASTNFYGTCAPCMETENKEVEE